MSEKRSPRLLLNLDHLNASDPDASVQLTQPPEANAPSPSTASNTSPSSTPILSPSTSPRGPVPSHPATSPRTMLPGRERDRTSEKRPGRARVFKERNNNTGTANSFGTSTFGTAKFGDLDAQMTEAERAEWEKLGLIDVPNAEAVTSSPSSEAPSGSVPSGEEQKEAEGERQRAGLERALSDKVANDQQRRNRRKAVIHRPGDMAMELQRLKQGGSDEFDQFEGGESMTGTYSKDLPENDEDSNESTSPRKNLAPMTIATSDPSDSDAASSANQSHVPSSPTSGATPMPFASQHSTSATFDNAGESGGDRDGLKRSISFKALSKTLLSGTVRKKAEEQRDESSPSLGEMFKDSGSKERKEERKENETAPSRSGKERPTKGDEKVPRKDGKNKDDLREHKRKEKEKGGNRDDARLDRRESEKRDHRRDKERDEKLKKRHNNNKGEDEEFVTIYESKQHTKQALNKSQADLTHTISLSSMSSSTTTTTDSHPDQSTTKSLIEIGETQSSAGIVLGSPRGIVRNANALAATVAEKPAGDDPTAPSEPVAPVFVPREYDAAETAIIVFLQSRARGRFVRTDLPRTFKRWRRRKMIADEILSTEEFYIESLTTILVFQSLFMAFEPKAVVQDMNSLFMSVSIILGINKKLLNEIRTRLKQWYSLGSRIADIFLDIVVFFKCYNDYVNKYEKATVVLKNPEVAPLLQAGRADKRNTHHHDLSNLLIMPIQRLPRYVLLLQELLQHTDETHNDYESLKQALKTMAEVTKDVNEKKSRLEKQQSVYQIASHVQGLNGLHQEVTRLYTYQSSACLVDRESNEDDVKLRCTAVGGDANEICVKFATHVYLFLFNDLLLVTKEQEQETGLFRGVMNKGQKKYDTFSFTKKSEFDHSLFENWKSYAVEEIGKNDLKFRSLFHIPLLGAEIIDFDDKAENGYFLLGVQECLLRKVDQNLKERGALEGAAVKMSDVVVGSTVPITNPANVSSQEQQAVSLELFVFPTFAAKEKWLLTLSSSIWAILVNKRTRYFGNFHSQETKDDALLAVEFSRASKFGIFSYKINDGDLVVDSFMVLKGPLLYIYHHRADYESDVSPHTTVWLLDAESVQVDESSEGPLVLLLPVANAIPLEKEKGEKDKERQMPEISRVYKFSVHTARTESGEPGPVYHFFLPSQSARMVWVNKIRRVIRDYIEKLEKKPFDPTLPLIHVALEKEKEKEKQRAEKEERARKEQLIREKEKEKERIEREKEREVRIYQDAPEPEKVRDESMFKITGPVHKKKEEKRIDQSLNDYQIQSCISRSICTFAATSTTPTFQYFQSCSDCPGLRYVCEVCVAHCHRDCHTVMRETKRRKQYCECGASGKCSSFNRGNTAHDRNSSDQEVVEPSHVGTPEASPIAVSKKPLPLPKKPLPGSINSSAGAESETGPDANDGDESTSQQPTPQHVPLSPPQLPQPKGRAGLTMSNPSNPTLPKTPTSLNSSNNTIPRALPSKPTLSSKDSFTGSPSKPVTIPSDVLNANSASDVPSVSVSDGSSEVSASNSTSPHPNASAGSSSRRNSSSFTSGPNYPLSPRARALSTPSQPPRIDHLPHHPERGHHANLHPATHSPRNSPRVSPRHSPSSSVDNSSHSPRMISISASNPSISPQKSEVSPPSTPLAQSDPTFTHDSPVMQSPPSSHHGNVPPIPPSHPKRSSIGITSANAPSISLANSANAGQTSNPSSATTSPTSTGPMNRKSSAQPPRKLPLPRKASVGQSQAQHVTSPSSSSPRHATTTNSNQSSPRHRDRAPSSGSPMQTDSDNASPSDSDTDVPRSPEKDFDRPLYKDDVQTGFSETVPFLPSPSNAHSPSLPQPKALPSNNNSNNKVSALNLSGTSLNRSNDSNEEQLAAQPSQTPLAPSSTPFSMSKSGRSLPTIPSQQTSGQFQILQPRKPASTVDSNEESDSDANSDKQAVHVPRDRFNSPVQTRISPRQAITGSGRSLPRRTASKTDMNCQGAQTPSTSDASPTNTNSSLTSSQSSVLHFLPSPSNPTSLTDSSSSLPFIPQPSDDGSRKAKPLPPPKSKTDSDQKK